MFCIHVSISDMSCPAMNSWKLRCCKARKRVGTGGLTALRSLFKIFFLHSLDAENPNMSRCRETRRVVNAVDRKERTRLALESCGAIRSAGPELRQHAGGSNPSASLYPLRSSHA